ncbi:T6SS phospholipase effector Tle1-like catalytic domain-containing protein [Rahnella sp. PAMC 25559]|uniref:T6SS phospholipase effector Tle1-like catalytic domain-containing protein n=1 Tax=Rahnella sp. PAMC 25559 TaxID=3423225 RepID=UPI003D674B7D
MSEIKSEAKDLVWYPQQFPKQGRLPTQAALVGKNCHQQDSHERAYRQELCLAANRRVEPPCCNTLHVSLFFDGTGNNLNNDLYLSDPKHPTNIARLFRATIGTGYAGGVQQKEGLLDTSDSVSKKYFKYYIPGVGTPFTEINDLEYSMTGLAGARYGEDRVNWGLLRLIDALMRTMGMDKLDDSACLTAIKEMGTSWAALGLGGSHNRYEEFSKQLKKLEAKLRIALSPAEPGKPKLLGIKLYVYGFSRGAAEARAFVRWLSELLPKPEAEGQKPPQCLAVNDLKIPISVEFLGLLDTVASVGMAHIAPVAEGHMAWADGTQELPDEATYGGLIKRCVHLVSSNEQRLCFPLDSIRHTDGKYPLNSVEVVYPGMHSDLGGGYPPGDQGKATSPNDGLLISQIALHDMYAAAFAVGAPLKVSPSALPQDLRQELWRAMQPDLQQQFVIFPELIARFNAWRQVTLNLPPAPQEATAEQAAQFDPVRASVTLENAVENQIAWITAWRINRYAGATMLNTPFYQQLNDKDGTDLQRNASKADRKEKQNIVEEKRKEQLAAQRPGDPPPVLMPGVKDFDPDIPKTQLYQAALEFGEDYRGESRSLSSGWQLVLDTIPQNAIFLINTDDEREEFDRIKTRADPLVKILFPSEGEANNATQPSGLLRSLYDDQVHDSRAWFLHGFLGSRELWASYFRYRMIYFGDNCNKELSLLTIAGNVVGAATLVGGVVFSFKQKSLTGKLAGLAGTAGAMSLETKALDLITRQALPMLPEAEQLTAFTQAPGVIASQQKQLIGEQQIEQAKTMIASRWAQAQSLLTT